MFADKTLISGYAWCRLVGAEKRAGRPERPPAGAVKSMQVPIPWYSGTFQSLPQGASARRRCRAAGSRRSPVYSPPHTLYRHPRTLMPVPVHEHRHAARSAGSTVPTPSRADRTAPRRPEFSERELSSHRRLAGNLNNRIVRSFRPAPCVPATACARSFRAPARHSRSLPGRFAFPLGPPAIRLRQSAVYTA